MYVTVIPLRPADVSLSVHCGQVATAIGAQYSFATEGDPDADEKRARGLPVDFTLIPRIQSASTTEAVRKLFPD
jgi:hypothetical protein